MWSRTLEMRIKSYIPNVGKILHWKGGENRILETKVNLYTIVIIMMCNNNDDWGYQSSSSSSSSSSTTITTY